MAQKYPWRRKASRLGRLVSEFLAYCLDGLGASRFEMSWAQVRERVDGLGVKILGVFESQIAAAREFGASLTLFSMHGIDGIPKDFHHVKLIEGDPNLGTVRGHALDEGGRPSRAFSPPEAPTLHWAIAPGLVSLV